MPGTEESDRPLALEGERITLRPVQRSVSAVGSFLGFDEVTVMAEVTGRVAKVFHDVGDIVKPGDVLMELDTIDLELELEQTRRALELEVVRLGVQVPEEASVAGPDHGAAEGLSRSRRSHRWCEPISRSASPGGSCSGRSSWCKPMR